MYEVLVAVDDDEGRARAQARTVADLPSADEEVSATLLHVFTDNVEGASVHQVPAVRRAKERLETADIDVTLAETSGDPATRIVERAEADEADAVCLAGRKRTPTGKVLFGSVTQAVILETDRAVLIARSDDQAPA